MEFIGLNLNDNVAIVNIKKKKKREDSNLRIVNIKDKYKKDLPLNGIRSRLATALVLGYLGYREKVIILMQHISHRTRAYIQNANFLHGFLVKGSIVVSILELANDSGELDAVTRWHVVDLEKIKGSLAYFDTL